MHPAWERELAAQENNFRNALIPWDRRTDLSWLLADGANVILLSCSTGEGGKTAANVANFVRSFFPSISGNLLYAPMKQSSSHVRLMFDRTGKVTGIDYGNLKPEEVLVVSAPLLALRLLSH